MKKFAEMTKQEKREALEAVVEKYAKEAEECREHARIALERHRKEDYDFWMKQYEVACNEREYYFQRAIEHI